jgi:type I restriction enzyme S subunit
MLRARSKGATVPHIDGRFLASLEIPTPSPAEQQRIAEILDRAERLRAERRDALARVDALTQSIFLDMFGDPATNPQGWGLSTVGAVAEIQGGLQVSSRRGDLPVEIPYLRVANVHRGRLELSEVKTMRATEAEIKRTRLVTHDLLVVEGHGNPAEIGRSALWDGSIEPCVHQNHLIRVRFRRAQVWPVYGCAHLNSAFGRRHLLRSGKTTSGLNTISTSNVSASPIPVPPLQLQQEFARAVASIEDVVSTLAASGRMLDVLFESLQHRAFRGEL